MEYTIITKKEAVEPHGNQAQQKHFEKYKKFKRKNIENALIVTLNQIYESV